MVVKIRRRVDVQILEKLSSYGFKWSTGPEVDSDYTETVFSSNRSNIIYLYLQRNKQVLYSTQSNPNAIPHEIVLSKEFMKLFYANVNHRLMAKLLLRLVFDINLKKR